MVLKFLSKNFYKHLSHSGNMDQSYYMLKKGNEIIYSGNNHEEMMELIPKDDSYLYSDTPKYNLLV